MINVIDVHVKSDMHTCRKKIYIVHALPSLHFELLQHWKVWPQTHYFFLPAHPSW